MKKHLSILLTLIFILALAACGGAGSKKTETESVQSTEAVSDFEWTRTGYFQDEAENYLMIYPSTDEAYAGMWAVTFMIGEDIHGWMIAQEGEMLHGDLTAEGQGDPYVVTISEEGEGVLLKTEAGDEYHMAPVELPEILATMQINTEGLGLIAYAPEGEEPSFDVPSQSSVVNILEGETNKYTIEAKAEEGYTFVKWTKNGEDYSEDARISVEVTEDVEYIAVFEPEEN